MIYFNYETAFNLADESKFSDWITAVAISENKTIGEINYIFCDDEYLIKVNVAFLNHDTYTDIITFDYSVGNEITADIYISVDMVRENAIEYHQDFKNELLRVMSHGILHCCGFKDKNDADCRLMRNKENEKIALFHVEQD